MILIEAHSVKVIVKFVAWLKIHQAYPNTSPRPVLSPCLGCRYPTHCSSSPSPLSAIWEIFSMQHGKSQIWKLSAVLKIYDFVNTHTPMSGCVCVFKVCYKFQINMQAEGERKSEMGKTLQPFHMFHFATNYRNRRLFQVYAKFPTWFFERTYNSYITVKWHFYCLAKKYREEGVGAQQKFNEFISALKSGRRRNVSNEGTFIKSTRGG